MMPVVSVLMPFHRVHGFLRPAVKSILDQSLADWELILVDNGTGVEASFFEGDRRIKLLRLPTNRGPSGALKEAVCESRGEFIALLDSDDLALPSRLERQAAVLRDEPRLDLLFALAEGIDDTGRNLGREFTLTAPGAQRSFSAYSVPGVTSTWMGRAELFRRFPFRDEFVAGDFDFFSRVADHGQTKAVPEVLGCYRHHRGQTTHQGAQQVIEACFIRRLAARRRSGRDEGLAELVADMRGWLAEGLDAAGAYRRTAEACLTEGFALQAVFHARRHLSRRLRPSGFVWGLRMLASARAVSEEGDSRLAAMFFGGPLRYHGLRRA